MSSHVKQNPQKPPGTLGLGDEMELWAPFGEEAWITNDMCYTLEGHIVLLSLCCVLFGCFVLLWALLVENDELKSSEHWWHLTQERKKERKSVCVRVCVWFPQLIRPKTQMLVVFTPHLVSTVIVCVSMCVWAVVLTRWLAPGWLRDTMPPCPTISASHTF